MIFAFLEGVFYLFSLIYLLRQLEFIWNPHGEMVFGDTLRSIYAKYKRLSTEEEIRDFLKNDMDKFEEMLKVFQFDLLIVIWVYVGLLTSQWLLFLSLIVINLFILPPIKARVSNSVRVHIIYWNAVFGFLLGLFVLINKYYIGINFYLW